MSEIERQFFEAFEIESKYKFKGCENGITFYTYGCDIPSRKGCPKEIKEKLYPQITDRRLLKLICLMGNTDYFLITNWGTPIDIDGLKDSVLHSLTIYSKFHKGLKEQVQAIFKEQ